VSAERPAFHEARPASLREADVDDIEVSRDDRLRENRARLARNLRAEVAIRQVREREHAHVRRTGELRHLGRGRMQRLVRPLLLLRCERRLVHEQVGSLGRLEDDPGRARVPRDDHFPAGPRRPEHLFGPDLAPVRRRHGLAALKAPEERAFRHAERARRLDVETAGPLGLDECIPVRVHAVLDLEDEDLVVAPIELVPRP
jgi:hypothetical protein